MDSNATPQNGSSPAQQALSALSLNTEDQGALNALAECEVLVPVPDEVGSPPDLKQGPPVPHPPPRSTDDHRGGSVPFRDRTHAGEELALRMLEWADSSDLVDPVVLALPRGGVPVAAPVAHALHAPLDVLVA